MQLMHQTTEETVTRDGLSVMWRLGQLSSRDANSAGACSLSVTLVGYEAGLCQNVGEAADKR